MADGNGSNVSEQFEDSTVGLPDLRQDGTHECDSESDFYLEPILANESVRPLQKYLRLMLENADRVEASDLYAESSEIYHAWHCKVNGHLLELDRPPRAITHALGDEIKHLFGLLDERKKPSKGRLWWKQEGEMEFVPKPDVANNLMASTTLRMNGRQFGLNLTRLPHAEGENYHIELFDSKHLEGQLDARINNCVLSAPRGLVVLASPANEGKTTTAYNILTELSPCLRAAVGQRPAYPCRDFAFVHADPSAREYAQTLHTLRAYAPDVVFFDDVDNEHTAKEVVWHARRGLAIAAVTASDAGRGLEHIARLAPDATDILTAIIAQRLVWMKRNEHEGNGSHSCDDITSRKTIAAYHVVEAQTIPLYTEALRKGTHRELGECGMCNALEEVAPR